MKKIKKYKSGRRVYTLWDKITEQVRVISKKNRTESGEHRPVSGQDKAGTVQVKPAGIAGTPVSDTIPADRATYRPFEIPERFANLFAVHHTQEEFILDFFLMDESANKARHCSRIILSPKSAKKLLVALKKCQ